MRREGKMSYQEKPGDRRQVHVLSDVYSIVQTHVCALRDLDVRVSWTDIAELQRVQRTSLSRDLFIVHYDDIHVNVVERVRQIRALSTSAGIVCIMGLADDAVRLAAAQAGADHGLARSSPPELVRSVVGALLRRL